MKQWLKRTIPDREKIRGHKHLRVFGKLLHDPNLWHLNRRSVSGAFAVGLFVMYLPPVGQMLVAAAGAIAFRVNLPIAATLVWITNPLTIPPLYYFGYRVGTWILGETAKTIDVQFWFEWRNWLDILAPLTVGCLICATVCSTLGYLTIQGIWRWNLVRQIHIRRARYRSNSPGVKSPSSKRQT